MRNYSSCYIVIEPSLPESRKNGGLRYESNGKENRKDILLYLAVILLVLWTLLPIIWMFISSIISENELLSSDKILPTNINYLGTIQNVIVG